jgi:hypothetical protein
MPFHPLSELSITNKTFYPAFPFKPAVTSDGSTLRHFACALGTSRPALLHFRLIFIESRSLVHSVQRTRCFYLHDNVHFREDSLSLPNSSSSSRRDVKHVVDFQGRSCYRTLTEDIRATHIKFQHDKTVKGEYRPHLVRVADSRRRKGTGTVEGKRKWEGNGNKQERHKEFSWKELQQTYRNIW